MYSKFIFDSLFSLSFLFFFFSFQIFVRIYSLIRPNRYKLLFLKLNIINWPDARLYSKVLFVFINDSKIAGLKR